MTNTYLGYEDIVTRNFYKMSETNDLRWFFKDFDVSEGKELKDNEILTLVERFKQRLLDSINYLDDYKTKEY